MVTYFRINEYFIIQGDLLLIDFYPSIKCNFYHEHIFRYFAQILTMQTMQQRSVDAALISSANDWQ